MKKECKSTSVTYNNKGTNNIKSYITHIQYTGISVRKAVKADFYWINFTVIIF